MPVALDTTAHPGGNAGNIGTTKTNGVSGIWQNMASGSFSTGTGPLFLVCKLWAAGSAAPMPFNQVTNTSGLTWVKEISEVCTGGGAGNAEIWCAFSSAGSLSGQTITAQARSSSSSQQGLMDIEVWNVPGATSIADCLGVVGGFVDNAGTSLQISQTLNAGGAGSVLTGIFGQDNDTTAQTANANTTPFDTTWTGGSGFDWAASGWYKAGPTSGAGNVTIGASTSSPFGAAAAIEIKLPAGGGSSFTGTQAETATPSVSFVGSQAMGASEAESASATDTYAAAQAMVATQAESTSAAVLLDGAVLIPASQSESAQALDSYALALALSVQQAETATPGFSLACSLAMGATYLEATSPSVSFDDGTPAPRRVAGFPFWPWWYRLHPYNRRRIM